MQTRNLIAILFGSLALSLALPTLLLAQSDWTKQQLVNDLNFIEKELPEKHKNLFATLSREAFQSEIEKLKKQIPEILADREKTASSWQLGLMSLLAKVGDGHTNIKLDFSKFEFIPANFKVLSDGVFIRAIAQQYGEHLGSRVTEIGDIPMQEVIERLNDLIPHDNIQGLHKAIDFQLNTYDYLTFIGAATAGEPVKLTLEKDNKTTTLNLPPYGLDQAKEIRWKSGRQGVNFGVKDRMDFWNDYLKKDKILYFKYNRCRNPEGFARLVNGTAGFMQQNQIDKFVLDLRDNGGGNSTVFRPLLNYLISNNQINQKGKLFVIVGRQTYSSAILNTLELKEQTNATIVGEPTSGKPNHFGEVRSFTLPNSGVRINYSTKYFQRIKDSDPDTVQPDVLVPLRSTDWFAGRNSALEAIKKQ